MKPPIKWHMIRSICNSCHIKDCDMPNIFPRKPEIQKKYLLDKFRNNPMKLKELLFNNHKIPYFFRRNEYPYHFELGLEHWVLWINPDRAHEFEMGPRLDYRLTRAVNTYFDGVPYVYFRNIASDRTMHGIPHYHIVVYKK